MNILLLCLMNLLLSAETNLIIPKKLCKNCTDVLEFTL